MAVNDEAGLAPDTVSTEVPEVLSSTSIDGFRKHGLRACVCLKCKRHVFQKAGHVLSMCICERLWHPSCVCPDLRL